MAEAFYILFKEGPPNDWSRAAEVVLKSGIGLGRADATKACRFGHGLLPIPLTEEKAKTLAAALDAEKLGALAIPVSQISEVPDAYSTNSGMLDELGFHVQVSALGTLQTLPWESIRIVNAAYVKPGGKRPSLPKEPLVIANQPLDTTQNDSLGVDTGSLLTSVGITMAGFAIGGALGSRAASGLIARGARKAIEGDDNPFHRDASLASTNSAPEGPEVWLEVFIFEPPMRLRIRQRAFKYDYLASRRMPNTRGNFKLLVADILKFAPQAQRINHATVAAGGANLEQERFLEDEPSHELNLMVILTRAKLGLTG